MKTLIAANWKMHGAASWADKAEKLRQHFPDSKNAPEILICPPAVYLAGMSKACGAQNIKTGAQNCYFEASGAYTGEISADMVKSCGADYVILGHSERRALFGESCADVSKKADAAIGAGLVPIICIGESLQQRENGEAMKIVGLQLPASLPQNHAGTELVIAYEPVWAIGTGLTPTEDDIAEMHAHIRTLLAQHIGEAAAKRTRILYGGSVKPENAQEILALPNVDGALVGGASLKMDSFAKIAAAAS